MLWTRGAEIKCPYCVCTDEPSSAPYLVKQYLSEILFVLHSASVGIHCSTSDKTDNFFLSSIRLADGDSASNSSSFPVHVVAGDSSVSATVSSRSGSITVEPNLIL